MARITIEQAKARADKWQAQKDEQDREPNAGYYADASPHEVIRMWETGKGLDGKRLTNREFGCLVERWVELFGDLPPSKETAENSVASTERSKPEPLPADDTMLRAKDVVRLTGISLSTIKRMVKKGLFPRPMHLGVRSIGWPTADVKAFLALLDDQRRGPRQ